MKSILFIPILKSHLHHSFYKCFCFHVLFLHAEVSNCLSLGLAHNQAEEEHCKGQANGSSIQDLTWRHEWMLAMTTTSPCLAVVVLSGVLRGFKFRSTSFKDMQEIVHSSFRFHFAFMKISIFRNPGKKTWTKTEGSTTSMLKTAFQSLPFQGTNPKISHTWKSYQHQKVPTCVG